MLLNQPENRHRKLTATYVNILGSCPAPRFYSQEFNGMCHNAVFQFGRFGGRKPVP